MPLPHLLIALVAPVLLVTGVSTLPALAGGVAPESSVSTAIVDDADEPSIADRTEPRKRPGVTGQEAVLDRRPLGVVVDFDPATGMLVVAKLGGGSVTSIVTSSTRIDLTAVNTAADRSAPGGGSIAHLAAGALISKLKVDEGSRTVAQVAVISAG